MTRKAQTESELAFFERFRAITGLLAGLPVTPQRPPEPDLVVQTATGAVGLELTELVTGPVQRSVESAQGKTLERAEAVFAAEMGHPLFVRLYWRHLAGPRRPDPQLATWIAATIRANPPPHSGTVILDSTEPGGLPMEHPLIERIQISWLGDDAVPDWWSPRHWRPGSIGPEWLVARIEAKAAKPAQYRGVYSSIWLLISAAETPSSGFTLDPTVLQRHYESAFDRVFFAAYSDGAVHELRTRRAV